MLRHRSRHGQSTVEYGLLLALVCGVLILALPAFSLGIGFLNSTVNSTIDSSIGVVGGGGAPTPGPTHAVFGPPVINPPVGHDPTATVSCGGFAPNSPVSITFTPASGSPTSVLATTTADSDGNVVDFVVTLPVDAQGDYTFGCNGVQGPPVTIGPIPDPGQPTPPPDPTPLPTPIAHGGGNPTMEVIVNSCSAAYVRSGPTVHSGAVTLLTAGAGPLMVYVQSVTGGSWGAPPNTPWYTCDGQGDTWYQIASGTYAGDYIFTGGVHAQATTSAPTTQTLTCSTDYMGTCYVQLSLPIGDLIEIVPSVSPSLPNAALDMQGDCEQLADIGWSQPSSSAFHWYYCAGGLWGMTPDMSPFWGVVAGTGFYDTPVTSGSVVMTGETDSRGWPYTFMQYATFTFTVKDYGPYNGDPSL